MYISLSRSALDEECVLFSKRIPIRPTVLLANFVALLYYIIGLRDSKKNAWIARPEFLAKTTALILAGQDSIINSQTARTF